MNAFLLIAVWAVGDDKDLTFVEDMLFGRNT